MKTFFSLIILLSFIACSNNVEQTLYNEGYELGKKTGSNSPTKKMKQDIQVTLKKLKHTKGDEFSKAKAQLQALYGIYCKGINLNSLNYIDNGNKKEFRKGYYKGCEDSLFGN